MRLKSLLLGCAGIVVVGGAGTIALIKSIDFNQYKGALTEQVRAATGRELILSGPLDLKLSLSPAVVAEGVSLSNAAWGSRPEMVTVKRVEAEMALLPLLSRRVEIRRLILIEPDILLETDAKGADNWTMAKPPQPMAPAAPAPAAPTSEPSPKPDATATSPAKTLPAILIEEIRIKAASLTRRDGKTGKTTTLALDHLNLREKTSADPVSIDLAGAYDGLAFSLSGTAGTLDALSSGAKPFPIRLQAMAGGASVILDGTVAKPQEARGIDVAVTAEAADLAGLASGALPKLAPLKAFMRLRSAADGGYAVSDLKATIGRSTLAGSATLTTGGARPKLAANLTSLLVDLPDMLPESAASGKPPVVAAKQPQPQAPAAPSPAGAPQRVFSDAPLNLDGLKAADADLTLKIDRLILPNGLPVEALALHLALVNGKMDIQPLTLRVGGGDASGKISLDTISAKTATLAAKLDGKGIEMGRIAREIGVGDLVSGGKTDIAIDIRGAGKSMRALMAGLNGEARAMVGEGRIRNAAASQTGAEPVLRMIWTANPLGGKENYTTFQCGAARFRIQDGLARADKGIAFETGKVNVAGGGTLNLKTEELAFSMQPNVRGLGAGGLGGSLQIGGTLAAPSFSADLAGLKDAALDALASGGIKALKGALHERAGTPDPSPCKTAMGQTAPEPKPAPTKQKDAAGAVKKLLGR